MKPCPKCERQNADDAMLCDTCGYGFHKYKRLGGWLLVLVIYYICSIILGLFTLERSITQLIYYHRMSVTSGLAVFDYFQDLMPSLILALTLASIFLLLYTWFVALLLGRRPGFLRLYQIITLLGLIDPVLRQLLLNPTLEATIVRLLVSLAWLFGITLYFCRSERVRIYMGNDDYIKKALFKFPRREHSKAFGESCEP